jgi:hypothetical protein
MVKPASAARRHHFVPRFLMRPWLLDDDGHQNLHGYYFDHRRGELKVRARGLDAFCNRLDLLTLQRHQLGRDAIERVFFGEVDRLGAIARDLMVTRGPGVLSFEQRCDFARLMLSLEARRPTTVADLRNAYTEGASTIENDPSVIAAFEAAGIKESPMEWYQNQTGVWLADRALSLIQSFVDNANVGGRLVHATWAIMRLGQADVSLVLSDRPLVRLNPFNSPNAVWILPLTPKCIFLAANASATMSRIEAMTSNQFAKNVNAASVKQADQYAFAVDQTHEPLLRKWLSKRPALLP